VKTRGAATLGEPLMTEFLTRFNSGELIGLVSIVGGMLVGVITIVAHYWHQNRLTELKREMLNRGMSAEEIKTVLDSGWKN
jgi:hypothetical protein